jgi:hypothetical protein
MIAAASTPRPISAVGGTGRFVARETFTGASSDGS